MQSLERKDVRVQQCIRFACVDIGLDAVVPSAAVRVEDVSKRHRDDELVIDSVLGGEVRAAWSSIADHDARPWN